jgi:hypothetical protein
VDAVCVTRLQRHSYRAIALLFLLRNFLQSEVSQECNYHVTSETAVLQVVVECLAIVIAFGGAWFKSRTAVLLNRQVLDSTTAPHCDALLTSTSPYYRQSTYHSIIYTDIIVKQSTKRKRYCTKWCRSACAGSRETLFMTSRINRNTPSQAVILNGTVLHWFCPFQRDKHTNKSFHLHFPPLDYKL